MPAPRPSKPTPKPFRPIYVTGRPRKDERPALAAGHPLSWDLINRGLSSLKGAVYPFPVFDWPDGYPA